MSETGIGASVRRKEDQRFLTGTGRYLDDINIAGQTYAHFVRSPHAHAGIRSIDVAAAAAAPGVVAVLTGKDVADDGLGGVICGWTVTDKNGEPMKAPPHPLLAVDTVRYVGDHVAIVIAETLDQAEAAGALLEVDYDVRPSVVSPPETLNGDAPAVHGDVPGNLVYDWELGDAAATDAAIKGAAHVTSIDIVNNRLIPNAIEPRAAIGEYNPGTGDFTLHTTSQNPHVARLVLSAFVQIAPETKLTVIAPDLGGGFGSKIFIYPDEAVTLWAAKKVGRPVKWTGQRGEAFLGDAHGRDHVTHAELALDADGKFLGLKVETIANMGAYLSTFSSAVPTYLYGTLLQPASTRQRASYMRASRRCFTTHNAGRCVARCRSP